MVALAAWATLIVFPGVQAAVYGVVAGDAWGVDFVAA
jgi:hypothetical protein